MPNPRKPDALKRLQGTFRPDRSEREQIEVGACRIPTAPRHLADDERQVWNRYRRILQPLGLVAETDLDAFEMLVVMRANFERLRTAEDRDQKQLLAASKEVRSWQTVFGLTPQARATVRKLGGQDAAEDLEDFLRPPEGEPVN